MSTTLPLPAAASSGGTGGGAGHGSTGDPSLDARWYAAAVRSELSDLPADVVEELAGGLEADLAELAAESSTPLADRLGRPSGYADELRSAAGLAPRTSVAPGSGSGLWARATEGAREDVDHALTHLRAQRWWPGFVERAVLLRPAWWVLRGVVAAWLLQRTLLGASTGLGGLLLVLAAVAVSVEVGRRRPVVPWKRSLVVAGNVLAVLVAPFALLSLTAGGQSYETQYVSSGPDTSTGVWADGQRVTNLYPYDAQGRPLTGVQLLDDYGRPVSTTDGGAADWSGTQPQQLVPVVDAEGAVRWNAYPLRAHSEVAGGAPTTPPLPQPTLAPLVGGSPSVSGSEAPTTPAPAPTTASATPTAVPSATPTSGVLGASPVPTTVVPSAAGTLEPTPTPTVLAG